MNLSASERQRVLIFAPFGRDAELCATVLTKAGLECVVCASITDVVDKLAVGAGALVTVEDAVIPSRSAALDDFIARQPPWSDLPVLLLTKASNDTRWFNDAYRRLRNLTLLESPIRPATLISAVRAAVRARERQYEVFAADQRKDEFLAMLGHELRNPLAPIGAAAQLLRLTADDGDKVRATSQIISRQVKHMTSLIDDLLDVARVTRGLITLDRNVIDLKPVLVEAIEQIEPMLKERSHTLQLDMPSETIQVEGDRKRLVQIFANVLQNAAKYTPGNGLIRIGARVDDGMVAVDISDNGIGMAEEVVRHVFDLFSQAQRSADRSQGGLGLGLSIVDSLIKSHNGKVRAFSEGLGKGSTFTIQLPIHHSAVPAPGSGNDATEHGKASGMVRALVVDDNKDAADTLTLLLQSHGYDVQVRYSARDALQLAQEIKPHLYLLDIGLPDMDGNQLAREIRSTPAISDAVLIAVTGYGQQEDKDNSRAAGFDHHFVKPLDFEELFRTLDRAVQVS